MSRSPVLLQRYLYLTVLIGGAAPTALQGRGALQDIDQMAVIEGQIAQRSNELGGFFPDDGQHHHVDSLGWNQRLDFLAGSQHRDTAAARTSLGGIVVDETHHLQAAVRPALDELEKLIRANGSAEQKPVAAAAPAEAE